MVVSGDAKGPCAPQQHPLAASGFRVITTGWSFSKIVILLLQEHLEQNPLPTE